MDEKKSVLFIVTGYSGAGKSTALGAFEDAGFFCVDNLPTALVAPFFQLYMQSMNHKFALGLDMRCSDSIEDIIQTVQALSENSNLPIKILFLTANSSILLKRFQETRRNHPLAFQCLDLTQAIELEKNTLSLLLEKADCVIPTDQLSAQQLRQLIRTSFIQGKSQHILVNLISFGFKYGAPADCNFVYDLRSLPNPYADLSLRPLNGTSKEIQDYLFAQKEVQEYWNRFVDFFSYTIQKSYREGRFFMTIAIGCTGGRHRSVAFVHKLMQIKLDNAVFIVKHRDVMLDVHQEGSR